MPSRSANNPPFQASAGRTVGVEWELALLDASTLNLTSKADALFARLEDAPLDPEHPGAHAERVGPTVTKELLLNTIELVTGICETPDEAASDLDAVMRRVVPHAEALGLELYGAGTHPFARWAEQSVSDGDRYATLIDRTQWWGRQMVIWGLHVHVGVTDRAKVWPLITALLRYYPHLTALAASSPFWEGTDTGYASNRVMMFQQLPTAGLPFQFATWEEYSRYLRDAFTTGVIDDVGELRWDVRPAARHGTIEVRICDAPTTLAEVTALTALIHCLVLYLEDRLDAGTLPEMLPPWHVQENKWRAARYGVEAIVITDADNREELVTEDLARLLEDLAPYARRLGCSTHLDVIDRLARGQAGYLRQHVTAAAGDGDLRAVVADMTAELRAGTPRWR
ncbi:MAG: glutamate--cysteine ligase [Mobilicoccus sp.]|nr:glutamate--cysteine ligase [Mobilicoccus sp.]